jgi:hypothetical protein
VAEVPLSTTVALVGGQVATGVGKRLVSRGVPLLRLPPSGGVRTGASSKRRTRATIAVAKSAGPLKDGHGQNNRQNEYDRRHPRDAPRLRNRLFKPALEIVESLAN